MKKKKVVLLGGLVLVLGLGIYIIALAESNPLTSLKVGNDLNMQDTNRIFNLSNPVDEDNATTWGYVKDAVNGEMSNIAVWRQDGTSHDVYLNDDLLPINLSGNVGIGTNDPSANLDILADELIGLKVQGMDEGVDELATYAIYAKAGIPIVHYGGTGTSSYGLYAQGGQTVRTDTGKSTSYAIYGQAGTGAGYNYAGYFSGDVYIDGAIGIGRSPGSHILNTTTGLGNDVNFGENLTVGGDIVANNLDLSGDITLAGNLTLSNLYYGPVAQFGSSLNISNASSSALAALSSIEFAFIDSGNDQLRTYRWNGSTWAQVGSSLSILTVGPPALAALSSTDVAFIDSVNDQLRTYRWSLNLNKPYRPW